NPSRTGIGRVRPARRLPEAPEPAGALPAGPAPDARGQPPVAGPVAGPCRPRAGPPREEAMSFTDTPFLVLLAVVWPLWLLCRRSYRTSAALLLSASVVFYGYHQRWLLALLLGYCVVNWAVGYWVDGGRRRWVLTLGVAFNLVVLAYWKYTPLLLR